MGVALSSCTSKLLSMGSRPAILVINPNSTKQMTDSLRELAASKHLGDNCDLEFFTAPDGPDSINNESDADESLKHCVGPIGKVLEQYQGFVVACYSVHPLVPWIRDQPSAHARSKAVIGIFEASIVYSLSRLAPDRKVGIVSTGKIWEELLAEPAERYIENHSNRDPASTFAGIETTGLSAIELHKVPPDEVEKRMKAATKRLLARGNVQAICLGCAGMTGLDTIVRSACREELGDRLGDEIIIVDGVEAGINIVKRELARKV